MKKNLPFFCLLLFGSTLTAQPSETKSILKSIYFGGGSYEVEEIQINEIYKIIDSIPHLERYQIIITSHTDNIGGKAYNEWLAKMRSETVLDRLLSHERVLKENVFIKDWGQDNPLYDNRTDVGRILNRRVDILFSPLNF
jgi:outer membrane protein OmpA-like peptidoglycan-associated protein